jgi:hypothetical protein
MNNIFTIVNLNYKSKTERTIIFLVLTKIKDLPIFYILVDYNLSFYKDTELKKEISKDYLNSLNITIPTIIIKLIEWDKKDDSEKLKEIRKVKLNLI